MVTVNGATFCGNGRIESLYSNGGLPINLPPLSRGIFCGSNGPTDKYGGKRFWLIDKLFGNRGGLNDGFGVIRMVFGWFGEKLLNGRGVDEMIWAGGTYSLKRGGISSRNGDAVDEIALKSLASSGGANVVVTLEFWFDGDAAYRYSGDSVDDGKNTGAGDCCDTTEYGEFILGFV